MKVRYLPWQPHCFAFGGLEIQMLSTLKAVQDSGVDAEKLDVWSRDKNFDILHVWGLDHIHEIAVHFATRSNKKVVITSLFQDFDNLTKRYKHLLSQNFGITKCMIKIADEADSIVVVNDIEAHIATKYFKVPSSKITYIPNIVDSRFFVTPPETSIPFRGISDFVLCTGNICKRKNQLNLVKACINAGLNLVIIGKVLAGEEAYGNEVISLLNSRAGLLHVENLKENSDELISAYHNCMLFALPSVFEQGPISAYEALVCGRKLLIADKRYSYQEFYKNVERVNPESVDSIKDGLIKMVNNPSHYEQSIHLMDPCKAENVGAKYKSLYESLT